MPLTDPVSVPPSVTCEALKAGFSRLGMRGGDTVLVHSSLSRFGHVEGGANAVIDSLLETLGSEGTLLMSAITTNPRFVTACIAAADQGIEAPVKAFDVGDDSTYAGVIAETFRVRPGVVRSLHPTHSVSAFGAGADAIIAGHENAPGPCGEETPYTRICRLKRGFILLLGVSHQSNTALHGMEELADLEYVLYPKRVHIPIVTPQGPAQAHTRVHNAFIGRNLNIFETDFIDGMAETVTHIGASCVRLVNAEKMLGITLAGLRKDPMKLLNGKGIAAFQKMKETGVFTRAPFDSVQPPA